MHLCLACLLAVTALGLAAAEGQTVRMAKNGNVRFGPDLQAGVVVTLRAGSTVELLGPVAGKAGWYQVRFPREGRAWMHHKNLAPTDQENILRVTEDGARVRADATVGSEVVADLAIGDTVEWKGQKVGDWYAVYPSSATAYVFHSVLDLSSGQSQAPVSARPADSRPVARSSIEQLWDEVRLAYDNHYQIYKTDRVRASSLDWRGLLGPLARVVEEHPRLRERLVAQQLRTSIVRMLQMGTEPVQLERPAPAPAPAPVAQAAETPAPSETATQAPVTPALSETTTQEPAVPAPSATVGTAPTPSPTPTEAPVAEQPLSEVVEVAGQLVVEGWLEERDIPGLGLRHVVLSERGVAAFVVSDDADLKQLYWRKVRVSGTSEAPEAGLPAEYANAKRIRAADVRVVR